MCKCSNSSFQRRFVHSPRGLSHASSISNLTFEISLFEAIFAEFFHIFGFNFQFLNGFVVTNVCQFSMRPVLRLAMNLDKCSLGDILTDLQRLVERDGLIREPQWQKDASNPSLIRCVPNDKATAHAQKASNDTDPQDHPSFLQAYNQADCVLWNVVVPIGLYRGKSIFWICENDPSYVFWLSRDYGEERHRIHFR